MKAKLGFVGLILSTALNAGAAALPNVYCHMTYDLKNQNGNTIVYKTLLSRQVDLFSGIKMQVEDYVLTASLVRKNPAQESTTENLELRSLLEGKDHKTEGVVSDPYTQDLNLTVEDETVEAHCESR